MSNWRREGRQSIARLIDMVDMNFDLPFRLAPVLALGRDGLQSITIASLCQKGLEFIKRTFDAFAVHFCCN